MCKLEFTYIVFGVYTYQFSTVDAFSPQNSRMAVSVQFASVCVRMFMQVPMARRACRLLPCDCLRFHGDGRTSYCTRRRVCLSHRECTLYIVTHSVAERLLTCQTRQEDNSLCIIVNKNRKKKQCNIPEHYNFGVGFDCMAKVMTLYSLLVGERHNGLKLCMEMCYLFLSSV